MILIYQCIHIGQVSIMNFCKMSIMNFWKKSFDFKVGSGRFRFGSFLNDRLKWSVRVVSAMPKVGASLITDNFSTQVLAILHNINVLSKLAAVCTNSSESNSGVESCVEFLY